MKLSYKPILVLSIITSITGLSCKKDKQSSTTTSDFPKTLQYTGITFTSTERVFTYQGEITDPTVKAKAITSTGLNLISHPGHLPPAPIVFTSKSALQINGNQYSLADDNGGTLLFSANIFSEINADDAAVKFAPLYKYPNLQSKGDGFIHHWPLILKGDYSAVKVSEMDFCYLQRDPNTNKVIHRYVQGEANEFNVKGINSLGKLDTLAIREYTANYAAKK